LFYDEIEDVIREKSGGSYSGCMEKLRKKTIKISSKDGEVLSDFYTGHLKFIREPLKILHRNKHTPAIFLVPT